MTCWAEHTEFQPEPEEWVCPECEHENVPGSGLEFFIIAAADKANEDCPLLHTEDECHCYACGYNAYGEEVAKKMADKRAGRVKCECCNGTGWVPKT